MSYSSLHSIIRPHLIFLYSETSVGPSLLRLFKSCFPHIHHGRKTLSSKLKLSLSVKKKRLKTNVWEAEQMISCLEGNIWKHYFPTARIRMQENAFKYISM